MLLSSVHVDVWLGGSGLRRCAQCALAHVTSGSNCAACHLNEDTTKAEVQAPGTYLGLPMFEVTAGGTISLNELVNPTGGDDFGVALSGKITDAGNRIGTQTLLPTGSVTGLNNAANLLKFTADSSWTARTRTSGTTTVQWYTIGGEGYQTSGLKSFNMSVDATTPSDYYQLSFATAGGAEDWSDAESFYVHVVDAVPEPSTLLIMGFGAVGLLVWRRRKRVK